jgi:signal recognition particle subunit SRP19
VVETVIWPAALDRDRTRNEGRRVPREDAVPEPTVDEIGEAVRQIGYDAMIDRDATYPREFEPRGRVRVQDPDDDKTDLLLAVAAYVAALRD